ncbi:alpha/beta hydrolase family protein, partial [Kibdelosporangium lantanae]
APALPGRHPVLLYSPGTVDPRTLGTSLAVDLASRGYLVVTMDHPGETSEVDIPGVGLRMFDMQGNPTMDPLLFRRFLDVRVADTRFVLDSLPTSALGRSVDLRHVGMYGHSAGGTTAALAMAADHRISAAINIEGFLDYLPENGAEFGDLMPIAENGTDRPLLLLGTDGYRSPRYDHGWNAMLTKSPCFVSVSRLTNAMHWVFTDFGSVVPQLQATGLMTEAQRDSLVGTISPNRSVPWIRSTVAGFFATHIRD